MMKVYLNAENNNIHYGAFPAMNAGIGATKETKSKKNADESPLATACYEGKYELVKKLIDNGADLNLPDNDGLSPIIHAAHRGHKNIIKLLVDKGAKINYQLFCIIKEGINEMEMKVRSGKEEPYELVSWKNFLDYLVQAGKKQ